MKRPYIIIAFAVTCVLILIGYAFLRNAPKEFRSSFKPNVQLEMASLAFLNDTAIPVAYSCDAVAPVSPPLIFSGVPEDAVSLALIMEDVDVPTTLDADGIFEHWALFNMPASTTELSAGASLGLKGANGKGAWTYAAPCPPTDSEPAEHRYFFRLFALDSNLELPAGATVAQIRTAMDGHVLGTTELVGRYQRQAR